MGFKDAVIELNEQNYSYTNEILYGICIKSPTILDKNTLASKIEIIGRVYAASPERRSYNRIRFKGIININKSKEEYEIDPDHHSSLKSSSDATSFPSWIIKPLGDGQGSFFTELAEQLRITEDFKESYSYCENHSFKFDLSNDDIDLLKHVIRSVLLFNQMIKAATMKVDDAPPSAVSFCISTCPTTYLSSIVIPIRVARCSFPTKTNLPFCQKRRSMDGICLRRPPQQLHPR